MRARAISGVLVLLSAALSGCCSYGPLASMQGVDAQRPARLIAWDGRIRQERSKRVRAVSSTGAITPVDDRREELELSQLKKYSPEWWAVRDALDRKDEAHLA